MVVVRVNVLLLVQLLLLLLLVLVVRLVLVAQQCVQVVELDHGQVQVVIMVEEKRGGLGRC